MKPLKKNPKITLLLIIKLLDLGFLPQQLSFNQRIPASSGPGVLTQPGLSGAVGRDVKVSRAEGLAEPSKLYRDVVGRVPHP